MLTYREITPQDHDLVLPFVRDFYGSNAVLHSVDSAVLERTFRAVVDPEEPLMRGVLFLDRGSPVGYLYITLCYSAEVGGRCAFLEEIYVVPEYRGRGFGKELLTWFRNAYPEVRRFRLEVNAANPAAMRLYERSGYQYLRYEQMVIDLP